jgi:hypothetical protein
MTEAEWLAATDPTSMLQFLLESASARKQRLYTCAMSGIYSDRLTDERSRIAIRVGERFADGHADATELAAAWNNAREVLRSKSTWATEAAASAACPYSDFFKWPSRSAQESAANRLYFVKLLQCLFGNPFHPVSFTPAWRTSSVLGIADQVYTARDFSAMPILADALEDAGCDDADILAHCRGPGPHVRGCWVVDLVLGKQ